MKGLSSVGVQDIQIEELEDTMNYISTLTGIPREDLITVGSVGKQQTSGDIDIAISEEKYPSGDIHKKLLKCLGSHYCNYNYGTRIGSYAFPIGGNVLNGAVQVDLMYVHNVNWAKFAYYSAGDKSKYKGAIRAILLSAVAGTIENPGEDAFAYDEDGELLARAGWGIYLPVGLKRMYQMRDISQKTGKWLKTMKSVSPDTILKNFPTLKFCPYNITIDDPYKVTTVMFNADTHPSDLQRVEDILRLIKDSGTFTPERTHKILEVAKKRVAQVKGKMEIPSELQRN